MQIGNPWASVLLILVPIVGFLRKRVKRATVIVPTIEPIVQVNTKFRYKYHDWAFGLRVFELIFLAIAAMDIESNDFNISHLFSVVIFLLLFLEIFLKNTFWRTLP
ncbi:MAG: hypothetical protein K2L13_03425 [Opitutales bacterium]|nr:hypothetical protein [Opitutales bacterium]